MTEYSPAWWLPGAHAQTIWGAIVPRQRRQPTKLLRWETADGDFLELHRAEAPSARARLLLLHGLEGTIQSPYAQSFFSEARLRNWSADMLVFRSCGDEMNRKRRLYHSGETGDLEFAVEKIQKEFPNQPLLLAGVSLGGNVLLKYLGEKSRMVSPGIKAAAAVAVPFDLSRSSRHIDRGFSRVYQKRFMRSLKRKALAKLDQFPDFMPRSRLARIRTMYDFDDSVTAPLHGFRDAADYYARSSSIGWIDRISIPTLLLNAVDDPFLPADVLDEVRTVAQRNASLTFELTAKGGHAAFVGGRIPFRPVYYAEKRVCDFLADQLTGKIGLSND